MKNETDTSYMLDQFNDVVALIYIMSCEINVTI